MTGSFTFLDNTSTGDFTIKISAKHIKSVEAHLMRGCPVIWIKPDITCAEKVRATCSMKDRKGAYFVPESAGRLLSFQSCHALVKTSNFVVSKIERF